MDSTWRVTILFGSQTGNSEDVAERISRQVIRMGCKTFVCDLKNYSITRLISESLVVFICSTTGNGEFPDNMKSFWKFLLRKDLPINSLCHIQVCVFGLGDSSYEKFNVVAKKLNKRLLQLGAMEFLPLTLADDQHELGYDAALDPWLMNFKQSLTKHYGLTNPFLSEDNVLPPKYKVQFLKDENDVSSVPLKQPPMLQVATVKSNKRITSADHFQDVRLIKFTIDPSVHYEPGDVAVVLPENPVDEVEDFLSLLNVPLDKNFFLIPSDSDIPIPKMISHPCTVRECAVSYFDIMSIPRRSFFEFFHHFSQDELEKEKLVEFTIAEGQEELFSYCNRPKRTILEVLKDFPHTTPHVPFEYFFDMIPCIRPRSFSIASSLSCHANEFHLAVAVVEYKTRLRKPRRGLCSNWLANLAVQTVIPYSIKKGSIMLPTGTNPIIMVGPGTGCAPFRSFIQERVSANIGGNYLFFGCRYMAKDFLFSEEWEELTKRNMMTLFTAFSRDQEDKIYVQHKIKKNGSLLWNLISDKQAYIYVAGNAKQMPQSVKEAFLDLIIKEGKLEYNDSLKYMTNLENKKRYQSETWA